MSHPLLVETGVVIRHDPLYTGTEQAEPSNFPIRHKGMRYPMFQKTSDGVTSPVVVSPSSPTPKTVRLPKGADNVRGSVKKK